jgi:ribosomal protein S18 acetylase RimI-like enzyme
VRSFRGACDLVGDLSARAEAGIDEPLLFQPVECGAVGIGARGLAQDRFLPVQAEPAQILEDRSGKFLAAARRIDVLDAQQEPFARLVRRDGGERMAEMQQACWTRREPRDNHGASLHDGASMIIRPARPDEAATVAAIKTESWRHAYRGIVPDAVLDAMNPEEVREHWLGVPAASFHSAVLVLEDEAALLGYAMFGPCKDKPVGFSGQLYELYVRPAVLGTGAGHALFAAATDHLRQDSHDGFHLWVFEDNRRARRFYERHGGHLLVNSRKAFDVAGHPVWEVAYGFRLLPDSAPNG